MIILSFDTTAKIASVAVHDDDRRLGICNVDNGLTQSELLLPMANDLLRSLHLSYDDVGLLATSVGPGSFTGVRIGTSVVKGLAFAKGIPCVGVSTLDELAENLRGLNGILCPCMDARRSQVYNALYSSSGNEILKLTEDRAISLADLAEELRNYEGKAIYLSGDGYVQARAALDERGIKTEHTPALLIGENASSVAAIAYRKYLAGECVTDLDIAPTYLRMPQAERERLERMKEKEQGEKLNG